MSYEAWRIGYQSSEQAARAAYAECERLQAKVDAMERQKPVAWTTEFALEMGSSALGFDACRGNLWGEKGVALYALPGARGEEK